MGVIRPWKSKVAGMRAMQVVLGMSRYGRCEVLAVELWLKKSQKILDATIKTGFMHRKAIEFSIIPLLS